MPSLQTYIQQPECGKPTMKLDWWWPWVGGGAEKDTFNKQTKKKKIFVISLLSKIYFLLRKKDRQHIDFCENHLE